MLKVTATNFGVNPSEIQIDAYNGGNFIILNGEISVDTSFEGYKSLFTLEPVGLKSIAGNPGVEPGLGG